jgi:formylglycine-generating enzyme required for sulfatase activity
MGGNVWQWCEDWYDYEQKYRVLRGGSWVDGSPVYLLSSLRFNFAPGGRGDIDGFRVVLGVGGSAAR